jgi:hypothetical protein
MAGWWQVIRYYGWVHPNVHHGRHHTKILTLLHTSRDLFGVLDPLTTMRITLVVKNAPVVARLCRRLDGRTLATELAAPKLRSPGHDAADLRRPSKDPRRTLAKRSADKTDV